VVKNEKINEIERTRVCSPPRATSFYGAKNASRYLNPVELVRQRVDDDEDVAELGGQDAAPVVAPVLRPDDVDLVVAQVPGLAQQALLRAGGHSAGTKRSFLKRSFFPGKRSTMLQAILTFGQLFENGRISQNYGATFSTVKFIHFLQKGVGLHFERFFHKHIW
jgi:hypothetical protein